MYQDANADCSGIHILMGETKSTIKILHNSTISNYKQRLLHRIVSKLNHEFESKHLKTCCIVGK